jgi:hypothetical protein
MPSLTENVLEEAATLPLKDAAFLLWRYKSNFDSEELPAPPPVDLSDPAVRETWNEAWRREYRAEREDAHNRVTFTRMKRVHPKANDAAIKAAIRAAVKLDDDCNRYFDRDYADFFKAIDDALARAKRDNPGFLETTYHSAGSYLLYLWK